MTAIFEFIPKTHPSIREVTDDLLSQVDFQTFVRSNVDTKLRVELSPAVSHSEKEQLYAYYHKVVLNIAMQVYSEDGWEGMDKVKADYFLKAECAKDIVFNKKTGREEVYLLDKASMNKDRLRKYVYDCIVFLEVEKGARVPDSAAYKMELRSGISGFQDVNSRKKD